MNEKQKKLQDERESLELLPAPETKEETLAAFMANELSAIKDEVLRILRITVGETLLIPSTYEGQKAMYIPWVNNPRLYADRLGLYGVDRVCRVSRVAVNIIDRTDGTHVVCAKVLCRLPRKGDGKWRKDETVMCLIQCEIQ